MSTITYLAAPYSHPSAVMRELRFNAVNTAAADLMRKGHVVFSPISHSHCVARDNALPVGWKFWRRQDFALLAVCDYMIVMKLDGWRESVGVQAEIARAEELGIPVAYIEPPLDTRAEQEGAG